MTRPFRIEYKGVFYHTTSRGNERRRICFAKLVYGRFKEKGRRYHCQFVPIQGLTPFFFEGAQTGKNWLRNEFNGYWDQRKNLITVLNYFGAMEYKSEHWENDAAAARLVADAVENDHA